MSAPSLSHPEAPDFRSASDRPRKTRAPRISPVLPPEDDDVDGEPRPVVLLAEDHEDSRDALRTLLDAFGYRVVEATNGREAVDRALAETPDIILMDMMMPRVDGLQATREIREVPALREVPIIALTAMEGARDRVMDAGCDDLVPKPIDVRSFLAKVREWLESGRPAA
jgi:CheY-like chemotaxis protein